MKHVEKTVFISYRRTDGAWALNIYNWLNQHGYDAFIDYEGIGSGAFETVIVENILFRAHFLVVLSPTALDRCDQEGDWLRREIEQALVSRRNIVPLMVDGFDFRTHSVRAKLTGPLTHLSQYNGLEITLTSFAYVMRSLSDRFLNVELDAVPHPLSVHAAQVAREQQAAANRVSAVKLSNRALDSADYYAARIAIADYVGKDLDWATIQNARIQRREGKWDPFETQRELERFTVNLGSEEGRLALCEIGYSYLVAAMDSWCCHQEGRCSKFDEAKLCDKSLEYLGRWGATVSGRECNEYILYACLVRQIIQPDADMGQIHQSAARLLECLKEKGSEVALETNMTLWRYALVVNDHAAANDWMQTAWDAFKSPDERMGWSPQAFADAMLLRSWTLARIDVEEVRHLFEAARIAIKGPIRYREVEFWMHAALRGFPGLG